MRYGSVCSGIEAASVAWHPLGWKPAFFAEIEPFPSAVLAERWPSVPNVGDFTRIGQSVDVEPIELLVGGTPCQSFSVAGKRGGLDDPRGNLTLEFLALAGRLRPRWVVWENVPGVLSDDGGRTFGAVLGILGKLGYGFAYSVLDAQYFGVPQRRRRVFVVGHLGAWQRAAAVLLEPSCLSGDLAPRRTSGEGVAASLTHGVDSGGKGGYAGRRREDDVNLALCVNAKGGSGRMDGESETFVAAPLGALAFHNRQDPDSGPVTHPVGAKDNVLGVMTGYASTGQGWWTEGALQLRAQGGGTPQNIARDGMSVRRLTPRECERLQGFPDDYTLIDFKGKPAADGPRYRAIGNSMAIPCMRWIGQRIAVSEAIQCSEGHEGEMTR